MTLLSIFGYVLEVNLMIYLIKYVFQVKQKI